MDIDWPGVVRRIERLRDAPPDRRAKVHGVRDHEFELKPPLTGAEVAEAEGQFGVRLPDEYRAFILQVSAGGAGPCYGLFPLIRGEDGRWGWKGDGGDLTEPHRLAEPFEPGDVSEVLKRLGPEPDEEDEDGYWQWANRRGDILWESGRTAGAICLCHKGCAIRDWLIVSGPQRGFIRRDERIYDIDLVPQLTDDGQKASFGRWYLAWLEQAERDVFPDLATLVSGPDQVRPTEGP